MLGRKGKSEGQYRSPFVLQARFQQKQLQEKEQKLLQLYDQQQQRAHEVAQRGSAGSNGTAAALQNAHSFRVRQMFGEQRHHRHNGVAKGIDKSYPLEPLENRSVSKSRPQPLPPPGVTAAEASALKAGAQSSAESSRPRAQQARAGEAATTHDDSSCLSSAQQPESRRSNRAVASNGNALDYFKSIGQQQQQHNGHRYEINIDEVIDNEAMERNRMLAKSHEPLDPDKRRRGSNAENEGFTRKIIQDAGSNSVVREAKKSIEGKSSDVKVERTRSIGGKGLQSSKKHTEPRRRSEFVRQSTLMNMTESSSLKINKLQRYKKRTKQQQQQLKPSLKRRQTDDKVSKPNCRKFKLPGEVNEDRLPAAVSGALKSTSIICDIMRNKPGQSAEKESQGNEYEYEEKTSPGKVDMVLSYIRLVLTTLKPFKANFLDVRPKPEAASPGKTRIFNLSGSTKKREQSIQDAGSRLMKREPSASAIQQVDAKEQSTAGCGESVIGRQGSIERPSGQRSELCKGSCEEAEEPSLKARRASFEFKRNMFEQMCHESLYKRHSVDQSFSYFDYVRVDVADLSGRQERRDKQSKTNNVGPKSSRLCKTETGGQSEKRGFERETRSWMSKVLRRKQQKVVRASAKRPKAQSVRGRTVTGGKKLLQARDSIELNRVSVKAKLACGRKKPSKPRGVGRSLKLGRNEDGRSVVESKSVSRSAIVRVAGGRRGLSQQGQTCKRQTFPSSTIKTVNADSTKPKRSGTRQTPAETTSTRKNNNNAATGGHTAKASDKSREVGGRSAEGKEPPSACRTYRARLAFCTDANSESSSKQQQQTQQSQTTTGLKGSTSLRFLNRIVESSGGASGRDNGFAEANQQRKSSLTGAANHSSDLFIDEKPISGHNQASARATASLTTNANLQSSRNQNSTGPRSHEKPKSNLNAPTPSDLTTCKICKRRFTSERINLHEQICAKAAQKKRKQFDALTQRVKGTELEPFVTKQPLKKGKGPAKPEPKSTSTSNWRRKHEDFINAIRSAKQMQAHLDGGGKLSDLPPPPPSDNSDYIQCPHCSRKFSKAAAERHIPKCENMQHNKPHNRPPIKLRR